MAAKKKSDTITEAGFEAEFRVVFVDPDTLDDGGVRFSTHSFILDRMLGGGFKPGTMTELYGPRGCLAEDSFIAYHIYSASEGHLRNKKGGTIARLYERFHRIPRAGKGYYARPTEEDNVFYAPSMDEAGRVFRNRVVDVFKTGVQECFRVETDAGHTLMATGDHKFWTGEGYAPLRDLSPGDRVYVHTPVRAQNREGAAERRRAKQLARAYVYAKHHPVAGAKVVGGQYEYRRVLRSRAVVEADLNGLSYEGYIERLNQGALEGLTFLPRDLHVHHRDEDVTNDALANLAVMGGEEHTRMHSVERSDQLKTLTAPATIRSITSVGPRETYDIAMEAPHHNYVANGIVVHNSGKSTAALQNAGEVLREGGKVLYIDIERGLDLNWCLANGIPESAFRDGSLRIARPTEAQEAYKMLVWAIQGKLFDLVILDSVAAMVPLSEAKGEVGDSPMGAAARVNAAGMRQALRARGVGKNDHTHVILINQARTKMGANGSSGTTAPGGFALEHAVDTIIKFQGPYAFKEDPRSGEITSETYVSIEKCRYAPNRKNVILTLSSLYGFDTRGELLDYATQSGFVVVSGAWFNVYSQPVESLPKGKEKDPALGYLASLQGRVAMKDWISSEPEWEALVRAHARENLNQVEIQDAEDSTADGPDAD